MSFTAADVVLEVREAIFDNNDPQRYTDAFILRKTNQIIRRMVILRPDLFTYVTNTTCATGILQVLPAESVRLIDVLSNQLGNNLSEVNQDTLDILAPEWGALPTGPAKNWIRYPRDPNRFYVYPPAQAGDTLLVMYVRCPPNYVGTDTVALNDAYFPVVVDGVMWLMESMDAEHVESGRAKMFEDAFTSMLAGSLAARKITDTVNANGAGSGVDQ